jgi:misacylated tRNA(Ala) deacylase
MTLAIYNDDAYQTDIEATVIAVEDSKVALDQTIAYPTGGGQPGDQGVVELASGERLAFTDTTKDKSTASPPLIWHHIPGATLAVGDRVRLHLDWQRRHQHMRFHTCMHVLCSVVKAPVTGGQIQQDRARLDFDIDMSLLDATAIAAAVNRITSQDIATRTLLVSDADLDAHPEWVKTMSVSPPRGVGLIRLLEIPGVDLQPCGGTHVRHLNEIGPIEVLRIRNEGKRNKRVEIGFVNPAS